MDKMDSFYTDKELLDLGLFKYGTDVKISRKASLYSVEKMQFGDHIRIDDFCVISGNISIGNYVHISANCCLFAGDAGIEIHDFVAISSRSAIYAISDDYSGHYLTNPTVKAEHRNVICNRVIINKHSVIGTGSTVLPGVHIGEGCSFGAMSLINKSTDEWGIYIGIPCKRLKDRSRELLTFENEYNKC